MTIKKFLHSCIFIEHEGSSILIDPGAYSFIEKRITLEDIPASDIILLTHEHRDHYFPPAIQNLVARKKSRIITNDSIARLLEKETISAEVLLEGQSVSADSFTIQAVKAPHGLLPIPEPENVGFFIDNELFHPGDSLTFVLPRNPKVLFLPISAPWLTIKDALETAVRVKPEIVVPIHDASMKDFMLEFIYPLLERVLKDSGVVFKPLGLGETLEI